MRRALWAVVTVLALASVSCGGGAEDNSSQAGTGAGVGGSGAVGGTAGTGGEATCGNGIVEPMANEQCEPSVAVTTTCQSLGMGTGMVICAANCRLMMMCTGVGPVAGNGGGGTGG